MTNTLERGGTERQFVTMAHALTGGSFEVNLGCLVRRGEFVDSLPGLVEFSPGNSLYKVQSHRTRIALGRHLRRHEVVVAHAFDFYTNLMLIPTARMARLPVVIGSHRQLGDLMTRMQFHAQKAMFRVCDRVVCNSHAAAARLCEAGVPDAKMVVIPNALAEKAFASSTPALSSVPNMVRVGMVARMNDPVKNHRCFLRVAARLASKFGQAEFVLVGDGPLRPSLEALAKELGLGTRVLFLGDRHDITEVLASLDVTVLPSSSESLSNAILESMAAGVPVVAANVGGNPELIRDGQTGFLVAQEDEAFERALGQLLTDSDLRKACGERARFEAAAKYQVSQVRNQYEDLYRSLLAEKGKFEVGKVAYPV
jgi:glycosyltransferase involved in cell wall biosynthesis